MSEGSKLTPDLLRQHAATPRNMAWEGQARMLLKWAADLIEAAEALRQERTESGERT